MSSDLNGYPAFSNERFLVSAPMTETTAKSDVLRKRVNTCHSPG